MDRHPPKSRELNAETAPIIRDEYALGKKITTLAEEFGVSRQIITNIIERKMYGGER